jgi:hypothetical protein
LFVIERRPAWHGDMALDLVLEPLRDLPAA